MGRVLIVSPRYPYPTRSGFDLRIAGLLEWIALEHEVHYLVAEPTPLPSRPVNPHPSLASVDFVSTGSEGRGVLSTWSRRLYRRMARPSFTSWAYSPRRLTSRITEAQRAYDFDVILVQTPGLSVVLDTITGPFKIIDAVDLWYERYLSFDRAGKGRLLEHFRTPQVELQFYRRAADLTIASSLHDEAIMRADGHDPNSLLHVPVAFEPEPLAIECEEPNLLFAGASGLTNVDALDYFIGSVMPHVRNKMKDAKLLLLRSDEEVRQRFGSSPGVECLPDIDDVRDAYHKARVAVVPLRLGSGIKIKVLESLAFGVPTIVSPVASQGIDLKLYAQRDVTLDPERMAREVIDALSSESYRRELTRTAIETIRERYRPAVAYAPLMERLEREINRRRRRVPAQSEASGVASSSRG